MGAFACLWCLFLATAAHAANWHPPHFYTTRADRFYFVAEDFAVTRWRRALGIAEPPPQMVTHWRRHDQVGIGNALGGLTTATVDSFVENRELVLESRILQKFCEFVRCAIQEVPGAQYAPKKGADVKKTLSYGIVLRDNQKLERQLALAPLHAHLGCGLVNATLPGGKPFVDFEWPQRCLYSNVIRSLIRDGSGTRLSFKKDSLFSYEPIQNVFYSGTRERFERVININKEQAPVFDYSLHVRTISLVEDMSTEDGRPQDIPGKVAAFLASPAYQGMVDCFASQIADGEMRRARRDFEAEPANSAIWAGTPSNQTIVPVRPLRLYLATDAKELRAPLASALLASVRLRMAAASPHRRRRLGVAEAAPRVGEAPAPPPLSPPVGRRAPRPVRRYTLNRGSLKLARNITALNHSLTGVFPAPVVTPPPLLKKTGKKPPPPVTPPLRLLPPITWDVTVDYFTEHLPPAHFFDWTDPLDDTSEAMWEHLAGSTADWLMLSQGRTMLTVKGTKGGDNAPPSTYSMSAGAFGRIASVKILRQSLLQSTSQAACQWNEALSFTGPLRPWDGTPYNWSN